MAPTPQEVIAEDPPSGAATRPLSGDEVVISGMSGIFPKSDSILELQKNLYNNVDMVSSSDVRWNFQHPEVPNYLGKVDGMGKFDAQFFRVHFKQACTMEPMSRKLLEHAYSAIFDSGINPLQLRGKKVGVFIGSTFSESEKNVIYENIQRNGFGITGCNKSMYANRISYWIDGKGPSYALDIACASSTACIEHAYRSISTGQCDAAIVGGCNLCMHPNVSLNMRRAGFCCLDGQSKCYDKNGEGYVRSDAISVMFLQKAKDAKRIYSEVYYAKSEYSLESGAQFLAIRQPKAIEGFLRGFYSDIDVSPEEVEYIEGHGSANAEAEGNELQAIGKVFAKDSPVKLGSIVSNMGHSEPASGVCGLAKLCLAYHTGELPANLHYSEPHDIPEVKDGKIQILQKNVPFNRGFAALNSFSYSGCNVHLLLKGHYKKKDPERYKSSIPRIVLASGRQNDSLIKIFNLLKKQPVDPEQIGLLHNIHENDIPGHMCRGYILLDSDPETKETINVAEKVDHYSGLAGPLWFVYSGMGSQWATMGAGLMQIPIFAAAIEKCHKVLTPKGINIMDILLNPDKTIYDNILHSFVGIAAVQIGLTDILTALGIVPDNIIGHSVGELGCAYADGCFTAEEMILSAYSRGLVSVQTPFIKGSMAAVGLGYSEVLPMCPPEIEVACHNSSESSTISGPADIMKEFVGELTKQGIFAKEVPCSNIAYHSRYIAGAGPGLLKYLSEVIKEPKERSEKWVSTSVPEEEWGEPKAKYSSAEYHTNNLLNSVLFEETSKLIPANATVIEVAPHGLLQAILKRSLSGCTHIPLTRRGNSDPVKYLLEAIGKLYIAGLNPRVDVLYPKIEFPVSTETALLSHFVGWEHSESWPQAKFNLRLRIGSSTRPLLMSIHDEEYKYFKGHVRNGTTVFPEAAGIVLVWETLGMLLETDYRQLSVDFSNILFHTEPIINDEQPLRFNILIYKGSNRFEVSCDGVKYVSGSIIPVKDSGFMKLAEQVEEEVETKLTKEDIYKLMKLKGFGYKDKFQSLLSASLNRTSAQIQWTGDWVTYLDGLIQLVAFSRDHEGLSVPKIIQSLTINTENHSKATYVDGSEHLAKFYSIHETVRCGGVELKKMCFVDKPIIDKVPDVLETQSFIPHLLTGVLNINSAIKINLQVVADNNSTNEVIVTEMLSKPFAEISEAINNVVASTASIDIKLNKIQPETVELTSLISQKDGLNNSKLFVVNNLLEDEKKMQFMHGILPKDSFVMTLEQKTSRIQSKYNLFHVVTATTVQNHVMVLLKKVHVGQDENVTFIPITHDKGFSWVPRVQIELQKTRRIVLVSERQPYCGLLGLVRKLKQEYGNKIGLVVVDDYQAPSFHPDNSVYKEQLQKSLVFNVYRKGQWGGYYYLPSEKKMTFENATLKSLILGDLDTLTWVERPVPKASDNLVQVHYAGTSLKDVSRALGEDGDGESFGMDFVGLNSRGERVMGVLPRGALANTVEADMDLLWPVPYHWTMEDAATVPLAYVHAYYCLGRRVLTKHSVFVNGGAGALGQAVISICLQLGCTVFTAVSDMKKKKFLLRMFPELDENNIANSRDGSFQEMIALKTKGKKCDYVINTTSGPSREAAMKCCGTSSLFIDVTTHDMRANEDFRMNFLTNERNYRTRNLASLFQPQYKREKRMMQMIIFDGIRRGFIRPLSRVVYAPNDVTKAFRLLAASKHRGRVLIKFRDNETTSQAVGLVPRMEYSSSGTHVVVCDEKELGLELIDHLVKRGAKNFVIHVKPKTVGGYFYIKSMLWKKQGVTLQTFTDDGHDIHTDKGCMGLLNQASTLGPVQGIFIVQDVDEDSKESFEPEVVGKKFNETAMVVANLDLISRNACKELQHFVLLARSSQKVINEYNIAVSEKICQIRNDVGLPGLVYHVGDLEEFSDDTNRTESNTQKLSYSAVFSALEMSLKLNYKNVRAFNLRKRSDDEFVRKIEKILGVKNINQLSEDLTVEDTVMNELVTEEIRKTIMDTYDINYGLEKVKRLTIANIKNLGTIVKKQKTSFDSGLGAFFSHVDDNEWLATEPIIMMPTRLNLNVDKEEELNPAAEFLLVLPGFEGDASAFYSFSEGLKLQTVTFQYGPDVENCTIPEMAAVVLKFVKARFQVKSKFYLLGYSFGVTVAMELAALLEKEGHVGVVFCLDSSPDSLRVQLDAYIGKLSDTQLQDAVVTHIYRLMSGQNIDELQKELAIKEDWPQKRETGMKNLRGLSAYSDQYKRAIFESAYTRITMVKKYKPALKLESELVLLKGIPHPKMTSLPADYNLSEYTKKPVQIFNIDADHANAPQDSEVTTLVNKTLDPQVLEEFKKKNLCEIYFTETAKNF